MFKISWDAGHGGFGVTSGKRTPDGSMYEWDFNSAVVKYAMEELSFYKDVAQLRVDDPSGKKDVPLKERTDRVNAWGSNVHVSVHANAYGSGWNTAGGIETYVYTTKPKEAVDLAQEVQNEMVKATGLQNRGVKAANFHVVRETKMPAILCECGFMTNKKEASLLKSEDYRKKVALSIVKGLANKYGLKRDNPAPVASSSSQTHVIQKGDTLWDLAREYNTTVDTLKALNPRIKPEALQVGQTIVISGSTAQYHIIQKDDTLWELSRDYGTTVAKLESLNPNVKARALQLGDRIRVK